MATIEQAASESGKVRGWEHANCVDAYGGTMEPEECDIEVPDEYLLVPTYYTAGYAEGVQQYISEQMDDAFPDLSDPREYDWCGNND